MTANEECQELWQSTQNLLECDTLCQEFIDIVHKALEDDDDIEEKFLRFAVLCEEKVELQDDAQKKLDYIKRLL